MHSSQAVQDTVPDTHGCVHDSCQKQDSLVSSAARHRECQGELQESAAWYRECTEDLQGCAAWHKKWKGIRKAGKIQGRRVTVTCCYGLDVYQVSQSLVLIHASLLPLIDTDTVI